MLTRIVYRTSDGKVTSGVSSSSLSSITVYPGSGEDQADVVASDDLLYSPGSYFYVLGAVYKNYYGTLELTSNKTDTDGDGVEDMPGDGSSMATYTIKKKNSDGTYATDSSDNDTITIMSQRGRLSALSVPLVNGQATFTVTAPAETCVTIIKAYHDQLGWATRSLQFTP